MCEQPFELVEEVSLSIVAPARFLFVQEGRRSIAGQAGYVWRSFFFGVEHWTGEPRVGAEVLDLRWLPRAEMAQNLSAPYHDSFLAWIDGGGTFFSSSWAD